MPYSSPLQHLIFCDLDRIFIPPKTFKFFCCQRPLQAPHLLFHWKRGQSERNAILEGHPMYVCTYQDNSTYKYMRGQCATAASSPPFFSLIRPPGSPPPPAFIDTQQNPPHPHARRHRAPPPPPISQHPCCKRPFIRHLRLGKHEEEEDEEKGAEAAEGATLRNQGPSHSSFCEPKGKRRIGGEAEERKERKWRFSLSSSAFSCPPQVRFF